MEEEDTEFFILVLGVLAAILLVVSWWFTTGGTALPGSTTTSTVTETADHDDDAGHDEDDGVHEDDNDGDDHDDDNDGDDHDDGDGGNEDGDDGEPASSAEADEAASIDDDATEDAGPLPSTVFDAVAANPDLSVLSGLLRDTDLDRVLASGGPFTVLAPSNDAFNEAASSDTTVAVLAADRESVLTYHVLAGEYTLDDLAEIARGGRSTELTTVQGEAISLTLESGNVVVNGSTTVSTNSQPTGNGLVHTLDNVLVPPVGALNALVGLDPILFASGSAEIQSESFSTLDQLIEIINASNVNVNIEGHTDSSGDPVLNQDLSQGRARSVLNYLVGNGVDEARLSAEGFGPSRPVADNDSEEGRALNRRIEFTLG